MNILLPGSTTGSTDENSRNAQLQTWLEGKGHTVTRVQSTAAPPANVDEYDLIFFGNHRGLDGSIHSGWVTVAVPLFVSTGGTASIDLKLFSNTDGSGFQDHMDVVNDTHEIPVSIDLSTGNVVVLTANRSFPRGVSGAVTAEGTVLANIFGTPVWAVYDEGAEMNDAQVAPARRSIWTPLIGSGANSAINDLNALGEDILVATMDWTANVGDPPAPDGHQFTIHRPVGV